MIPAGSLRLDPGCRGFASNVSEEMRRYTVPFRGPPRPSLLCIDQPAGLRPVDFPASSRPAALLNWKRPKGMGLSKVALPGEQILFQMNEIHQ